MGNVDEQFIKGSVISKQAYGKMFKPSSKKQSKKENINEVLFIAIKLVKPKCYWLHNAVVKLAHA